VKGAVGVEHEGERRSRRYDPLVVDVVVVVTFTVPLDTTTGAADEVEGQMDGLLTGTTEYRLKHGYYPAVHVTYHGCIRDAEGTR